MHAWKPHTIVGAFHVKDGKCTLVGGIEKKGFFSVLVGDDEWEDNQMAAKHCPVNIIKVEKVKLFTTT
jgi:ferredoxin